MTRQYVAEDTNNTKYDINIAHMRILEFPIKYTHTVLKAQVFYSVSDTVSHQPGQCTPAENGKIRVTKSSHAS